MVVAAGDEERMGRVRILWQVVNGKGWGGGGSLRTTLLTDAALPPLALVPRTTGRRR